MGSDAQLDPLAAVLERSALGVGAAPGVLCQSPMLRLRGAGAETSNALRCGGSLATALKDTGCGTLCVRVIARAREARNKVMDRVNVVCGCDLTPFRYLSSPGRLLARPKTPGGGKETRLRFKNTRTIGHTRPLSSLFVSGTAERVVPGQNTLLTGTRPSQQNAGCQGWRLCPACEHANAVAVQVIIGNCCWRSIF